MKRNIVLALFTAILLQSCTTGSLLYLRNPSNATVPVIVAYNTRIDTPFFSSDSFTLRFADTLLPVSSRTYHRMQDTILFEQLDTNRIRFILSPRSIIQVSNPDYISFIEMPQRQPDGVVRTERITNFYELQTGKRGFLSPQPYYYEVKE